MGYPTKIATCCFCGSRAALTLGGTGNGNWRHELACASCGAPLHDLKQLPVEKPAPMQPAPVLRAFPSGPAMKSAKQHKPRKIKHKKGKKLMRYLAKEAFDIVEDILD